MMKVDVYTKVILTIIAGVLICILLKPILTTATAQAKSDGKFSNIQASSAGGGMLFFDTTTGIYWIYRQQGDFAGAFKLVELGQPMQQMQ